MFELWLWIMSRVRGYKRLWLYIGDDEITPLTGQEEY